MLFRRLLVNHKNELGNKIEAYLKQVQEAVPHFSGGLEAYLRVDQAGFECCCAELSCIEKDADDLLRSINHHIYTYMLYPDMQKDISKLLNTLDDIVDTMKQVMIQVSIEKPNIPDYLKMCFAELAGLSCRAVSEVAAGTDCFFRNTVLVEDHVNKVAFYENEADKKEKTIKLKVHSSSSVASLSHKSHLCHFVDKIALPSDKAYRIAKDLLIYTINKDRYIDPFTF